MMQLLRALFFVITFILLKRRGRDRFELRLLFTSAYMKKLEGTTARCGLYLGFSSCFCRLHL
jgi:hypothetical protein